MVAVTIVCSCLQAAAPGAAVPAPGAAAPGADAAATERLPAVDVTLAGSPESMARQHAVAVAEGLSFVGTLEEMELLAEEGQLVRIDEGPDHEVMEWVFRYALPEVHTFVERLAWQYRQACGERLVVTSLTRPYSEQPPNAHQLSVHPAGMAVDLRISQEPACREFLESLMLDKEEAGLLDITRERSPPHYHIAVFPGAYTAYVATQPQLPPARDATRAADPDVRGWGALPLLLVAIALAGLIGFVTWRQRHGNAPAPPE
jgi:hypothetical protein